MQHNPSYMGGIAEIEPHYFRPVTPQYLQHYVSNTPVDRGDGVRPVMLHGKQPSPIWHITKQAQTPVRAKRAKQGDGMKSFGNIGTAGCLPCQAKVRNPIAMGSPYGLFENWKPGQGAKWMLNQLTPEQKEQLKGGIMSTASMALCERMPMFCPAEEEVQQSSTFPISTPVMIAGGVVLLGILGTLGYVVVQVSKNKGA